MFCSELTATALEESGSIENINASEVTPIDMCMFKIYADNYFQLKGKDEIINAYNSIPSYRWGM